MKNKIIVFLILMNLTLSPSVSLYAKDMFKLLLLHVSGNETALSYFCLA